MDIKYLVEKYSKLVYKICFNMLADSLDAEDATQDVYLNLYKSQKLYVGLTENELKNIICKIALNRCKDILKSKVKKLDKMMDNNVLNLEKYVDDYDIEEYVIKEEKKEFVNKALSELKEPYSTILKLYFFEEKTLDNISEKLNIPKATLKMQIYRGKKLLKEKIVEEKGGGLLGT